MKYASLQFNCRLLSPASFPFYAGSMLRGSLGAALRRGVCMTHESDCAACMLGQGCIFPKIFSGRQDELLTPPFCIEPDLAFPRKAGAGAVFSFGITLFAQAVDYAPFFVQACRMAGERGLGRGQAPARYIVEDVLQEGKSVYDASQGRLHALAAAQLAPPRLLDCAEESEATVELLTPLRFKAANQLSSQLDFAVLCNLIVRRVRALEAVAGRQWQMEREEFGRFTEAARTIHTAESSLRWQDWTRYSGRQATTMKLGGMLGQATYRGKLGAFAEFLHFAALAHVGKQTSFGLGRLAAHCG